MKLLLDENLPRQLVRHFSHHEVKTVSQMGWSGKKNGELLRLMLEDDFEVLLIGDKNLAYQQNFNKYPIPVLVLNARFMTLPYLLPLVKKALLVLDGSPSKGPTFIT